MLFSPRRDRRKVEFGSGCNSGKRLYSDRTVHLAIPGNHANSGVLGINKLSVFNADVRFDSHRLHHMVEGNFAVDHEAKDASANLIKVGTSAGGARERGYCLESQNR
jgi:hypothetical protein